MESLAPCLVPFARITTKKPTTLYPQLLGLLVWEELGEEEGERAFFPLVSILPSFNPLSLCLMARLLLRSCVGVVVGVVVLIAMGCGDEGIGRCEAAEGVHHVVGGDQGWDASSDVAAWSLDKVFRVGDNIWFTYPAAQGSIMELGSRKEFESCDLSNPIRMYASGLDRVSLDAAGGRYFSSGKLEDCQNGLKLHVQVVPQVKAGEQDKKLISAQELASGPQPSGSSYITASTLILIGLILLCVMGF